MSQKPRKLRAQSLEFFISDLGDLLAGGIDLDQALASLASIAPQRYELAREMQTTLRRGMSIDEVFREAGFPEEVNAFVRVGMVTGELEQSLYHLVAYLGNRRKRREKIAKLTAYPLFLTLLSMASTYMMAWQVIPRFLAFYRAFNLQVPIGVMWALKGANSLTVALPWFFGLALCAIIPLWWTKRRWRSRMELFVVKRKWGSMMRIVKAAQSFETLSALLGAGIDLLTSLQVMIASDTAHMGIEWRRILEEVEAGATLSCVLSTSFYIPRLASTLLSVVEQTGDLEGGTLRLKQYYVRNLERTLERFFAYFEPASLLFLGFLVGGITLVLLLPMTDLVKQLS